jgi:hypothetical protein
VQDARFSTGTISWMATSSPLPLTPELEAFQGEFDAIAADADALLTQLSDTQFYWSPAADVWSIAECLEHLNATARNYLPMLDSAIATAKQWGVYGAGPFHYGWLGRLILRRTEPPARQRMKAPAAFQPGRRESQRKRSEIEAGFRGYQVQFVDRLRQANGVDLVKAKVQSPVTRWVRLPLGVGFALMTAHERRHLWQARQLMQNPQFPRS